MGRRRRRNRSSQRDAFPIATTVLRNNYRFPAGPLLSDRRMFHPDGFFSPVFSNNRAYREVIGDPNVNLKSGAKSRRGNGGFKFAVPDKVSVCVRRKSRREVLFALRRTGKGSRSRKRRNYWSGVSCK